MDTCTSSQLQKKKVLVLGGTGFIGGRVVERVLGAGHDVTATSRGHWSWDARAKLLHRIRFLKCDRSRPDTHSQDLKELLEVLNSERDFDAVIDLSAYKLKAVSPFFHAIRMYIYISSDSVYEVCKQTLHGPLLREDFAVRPESKDERERLARFDSYGHHKLTIEEFLSEQNMPWVALRLPDVLGERDSTQRFWKYQLWLEYAHILGPVPIPTNLLELKTSSVYVGDVAKAVVELVGLDPDSPLLGQAYNFAWDEPTTLPHLLTTIATNLNINMKGIVEFYERAKREFPSELRETGLDLLDDLNLPLDSPKARQFFAQLDKRTKASDKTDL